MPLYSQISQSRFRPSQSSFLPVPVEPTRSTQRYLHRSRQRPELGQLIDVQPAGESRQDGKSDIAQPLRQRHRPAPRARLRHLREVRIRDLVHKRDVQRRVRIDGDEELGGVPGEGENGAGRDGWLEIQWWGRRGEGELGKEDDGQGLRTGDDEHLREVVGEDAAQDGVEGGGEGRGTEAGSQVRVMAGLDRKDGAGGGEQGWVVGEGSRAAEVGADADAGSCSVMVTIVDWAKWEMCLRGDHVG